MIVRNLLVTLPQIPDDSVWSKITWSTQPGQEQPEPLVQIVREKPVRQFFVRIVAELD